MTTALSNHARHLSAYAITLRGVGCLAADRVDEAREAAARATTDEDRMIYTGRCQAYSEILLLITGRRAVGLAREVLAGI